jgi:hypothetical protein
MKFLRLFTIVSTLLAVATLALLGSGMNAQEEIKRTSDIAVVVHPQNTLTDIKLSMLRRVLLGEQSQWGNHFSIVLVLRFAGTREQDAVLHKVVQMTDSQFKSHWVAKVFRGEATSEPLTVPSSGLASEYVASHPGAIAFLQGTDIRKDIKVLKVDGINPGADNYPLR